MKFSADRKALLSQLGFALHACEKKTTIPILSRFLIVANGDLSITATDLEIGIKTHVAADIESTGRTAIPWKILTDYLTAIDSDTVDVSVSDKGTAMVMSGKNKARIMCEDGASFPILPEFNSDNPVTLKAATFSEMLARIEFVPETLVAGTFGYRNIGFLEFSDGLIQCFGVGSHRVSYCKTKCEYKGPSQQLGISKRALTELKALCGREGDVAFSWDANHLFAKIAETTFIARKASVKPPDYQMFLNKKLKHHCSVGSIGIRSAIQRAAIFSNEHKAVKVSITLGSISTSAAIESGATEQFVDAVADGKCDVGMNSAYLLDIFGVCGDVQVSMDFSDDKSPMRITPLDDPYELVYVVMPMSL